VLFNGTNYRDWLPRMCLYMHGLYLWEFLTGELPYPPSTLAPPQPVISEKTTVAEKKRLIEDYDDHLD
jgi:ABC-type nitrate/sulfonate/bicarbonate transport system permease component